MHPLPTMKRSAHSYWALVSLVTVAAFGCTSETVHVPGAAAAAPGTAPTTPKSPGDPEIPPPDWAMSAVPDDVVALSCPTDAGVYAATATGIFHYGGTMWSRVVEGNFESVHLESATNGFAVGEGRMVQLDGDVWSEVGVHASWKMHSVYTQSDGAFVAGDGFDHLGADLLALPSVIFVKRATLDIRMDLSFGGRNENPGPATLVTGAGAWVSASGASIIGQLENGVWRSVRGITDIKRKSMVVVGSSLFATDGKDIRGISLNATPEVQSNQGGNVVPEGAPAIAALVAARQGRLVAVGEQGFVWVYTVGTGKSKTLDPPPAGSLTAGCTTSDGHLWVSAGPRVFRRTAAL